MTRFLLFLCLSFSLLKSPFCLAGGTYNPLSLPAGWSAKNVDAALPDPKGLREIPLRLFLPAGSAPAPVILFSHGLGGSRETCKYVGDHWSGRGFLVIMLQHPGSDDSLWKSERPANAMSALKAGANSENFRLRLDDVRRTLDWLNSEPAQKQRLFGCQFDPQRIGMSGHSFGAMTTQALSGQSFPAGFAPPERRIRAALMFSPSPPRVGNPESAFSKVSIPWMLMTGTNDDSPIGGTTPADRLKVYPAERFEVRTCPIRRGTQCLHRPRAADDRSA